MMGTMWVRASLVLVLLAACSSKQQAAEDGVGTSPAASPDDAGSGAGNEAPAGGDCVRSGCSGIVCVEAGKEVITTCEYRPEYACYDDAACERQPDGRCGWTPTAALSACLAAGGPATE